MAIKRIDIVMVERGLATSRARAKAEIEVGHVFCDGAPIRKPSGLVPADANLELRGTAMPWVSRGGVKLDHALDHFQLDLGGRVVLDVGASTGGFTDVALARGASRVYSVDVGHGQLDEKLRRDPRVVVLERVNALELTRRHVPEPVDAVLCDVSFISLRKVLPTALALTEPGAILIALIKPQFEAGPDRVGKGGIVRDSAVHDAVCGDLTAFVGAQSGWSVLGVIESPIRGGDGNREFLIAAMRQPLFR